MKSSNIHQNYFNNFCCHAASPKPIFFSKTGFTFSNHWLVSRWYLGSSLSCFSCPKLPLMIKQWKWRIKNWHNLHIYSFNLMGKVIFVIPLVQFIPFQACGKLLGFPHSIKRNSYWLLHCQQHPEGRISNVSCLPNLLLSDCSLGTHNETRDQVHSGISHTSHHLSMWVQPECWVQPQSGKLIGRMCKNCPCLTNLPVGLWAQISPHFGPFSNPNSILIAWCCCPSLENLKQCCLIAIWVNKEVLVRQSSL